jgi:8-oxo-dGTP diphosphatase
MVAVVRMPPRLVHSLLLRIWRDVPFPGWLRQVFLRILNPSFMVGAMALIRDSQGRILILEHTYRRQVPWGLPGGWLKRAESPEAGLVREVFEETGLRVRIDSLLGAEFCGDGQLDLLFSCTVEVGSIHTSEETGQHTWCLPEHLPELLPNQVALLRKVGVLKLGPW